MTEMAAHGSGQNADALRALESASTLHPRHPKAVLAMGSILQDNLDIDGALVKYRVAASIHPDSPQVLARLVCTEVLPSHPF